MSDRVPLWDRVGGPLFTALDHLGGTDVDLPDMDVRLAGGVGKARPITRVRSTPEGVDG